MRSPVERRPVDVVQQQMALATLARASADWPEYEKARDNTFHLVLGHRIEDEIGRFRQVMTACTGVQNSGEDARDRIERRLADAFAQGIDRRDSPHDLLVRMQRIPRSQATVELAYEMRRGDGEVCIGLLLAEDGHLADDVRAVFGDDPARIAAQFTDRDWADFATPLLAISPGELREDLVIAGRKSLRQMLRTIAVRRP